MLSTLNYGLNLLIRGYKRNICCTGDMFPCKQHVETIVSIEPR